MMQAVLTKNACGEITGELGQRFEISFNSDKPFACGIVIQPSIDACAQLRALGVTPEQVERIELKAHSLVMVLVLVRDLTGKKEPADVLQAKFSVYHGCAAGLSLGRAAEDEFADALVMRDDTVALRCAAMWWPRSVTPSTRPAPMSHPCCRTATVCTCLPSSDQLFAKPDVRQPAGDEISGLVRPGGGRRPDQRTDQRRVVVMVGDDEQAVAG